MTDKEKAGRLRSGGRLVVDALLAHGARRIFGVPGESFLPILDALVDVRLFNNGMYGTIRMHQERSYPGRAIGTALSNPDFASLAAAYGAHGERVERTEEFAPAFERAANAGRAAVIELRVDPETITTRTTLSRLRRVAG